MPKFNNFIPTSLFSFLTSQLGFTFTSGAGQAKSKMKAGFTFIELLIVITTMALVFGLGFANYRGYQDRQRTAGALRIFKGDLRFAQEQALAGIKPAGCTSLNGYKVTYPNVNTSTYRISANCNVNSDIAVKTIDLATTYSTVRFSAAFPMIFFNVLGRGVKMTPPTTSITVTLNNTKNGDVSTVVVTQGGEIN